MEIIRTLYTRTLGKIQRDGVLTLLKLAWQIAISGVYLRRRAYLVRRNLEGPTLNKSFLHCVELIHVKNLEVSGLPSSFEDNLAEKFGERLNNKKLGFLTVIKDSPASYCWVSLTDEYETWLGYLICVEKDAAYFYDSYTHPEYRWTGLHTAVLHYALIHLKNMGIKSALAVVGIKNIPALKSYRKLGFREVEMITTFRFFRVLVKTCKRRL